MTETPEDIATLYSRARIEWTRYWDFSASRKQVRRQLGLGIVRGPLEWPTTAIPVAEFPQEHLPQIQLQEAKIEDPDPPPQQTSQVQAIEIEPLGVNMPKIGL
jgi:hypothetical protein